MPGDIRELFLMYASKAGFVYSASAQTPAFHKFAAVCGGEMILSRFPIQRSQEHVYSYALFGDAEADIGVMYAEIQIGPYVENFG